MIIGYFCVRIRGMTNLETRNGNNGEHEVKPCVFCEIRAGNMESAQVAETDNLFAIISFEGHPIVLPKDHITLKDAVANPEVIKETYAWAFSLVGAVKDALNATGITVVTNLGRSAGQEFEHLHVHLIDRTRADKKVRYREIGRLPLLDRQKIASRISSQLSRS